MSSTELPLKTNRLLARFPDADLARFAGEFEHVRLKFGHPIIEPDGPIHFAYFPLSCLISMVSTMRTGATVECGVVGREGMVGLPIVLGTDSTPMRSMVQVQGEAIRIRTNSFKEAFSNLFICHDVILRYFHVLLVMASQSVACNRLHKVDSRMARWLLMSSDAIASDRVPLTHELLGIMLGVRRAGVTEAATKLREHGFIRYVRRVIELTDKEGLKEISCECYEAVKAEYERVLPALD
jgi:CRP-like cAMP-binding protein